jgi:peptide/nickel transport system ATP-binding protein
MMPSAILQVEGLSIASEQGVIVQQLSFQIGPGEIVALTGKSGSGKTSIALAILDLLPASLQVRSGIIHWAGAESLTLPSDSVSWKKLRGRHIGYTQQDAYGAFDPVMRMGSQMLMVIQERAGEVLPDAALALRVKMEEVGLHDIDRLLSSYPHQLSGGQLQRCQIAMALVIRPELLIADEPTSAIDKINQVELLEVFTMLRNKYNLAILCITHEEAVVRHLADREIRLDSTVSEFPLGAPDRDQNQEDSAEVVLQGKELAYTHAFGGMMHHKGAHVGRLDFALHRGQCLGIVGESGSGKSTFAQLLVGLYAPDQGQLLLDGTPVDFRSTADLTRLRSKVQLVMQDGRGSLHPHLSVSALLYEVGQIRQKLDPGYAFDLRETMRIVGLGEELLERTSARLSGGECLRVSIARALLMQPEVLICDESTSSLDALSRDGVVALLSQLMTDRKLALIFISHDERIIRALSDEVIVMADGKVVEKGKADQVIRYPTHPVTKRIFTTHATLEQKGHL